MATKTIDLTFDANGRRGVAGSPGGRGYNGGTGQDGGRGSDAGTAAPGEPGGVCEVVMRSSASRPDLSPGAIHVDGIARPTRRDGAKITRTLPGDQLGRVQLMAMGGAGGNGGAGGGGGDGGRGRRGSDATRYSSGSNGGRGGDGGNGGRGSNGAPGGAGGHCSLILDERDTYLLMCIASADDAPRLVVGGQGGHAGRHGRGGAGGSGGPGGSSYSWTESESYTDSEGNTQTRTTFHSNPGGSRGPSGSSGWTPTSPIYAGRNGEPGRFKIKVEQLDGTIALFESRYDLEIIDFELAEDSREDVDGIFEFGEIVHVHKLRLRNVGKMATPAHQRIRLILHLGTWVRPLTSDELFLTESLPPNREVLIEGSLRFQIPLPKIEGPGEPAIMKEPVRPAVIQLGPELPGQPASQTPFQRLYPEANLTRTLTAQFPVENREGIVGLRSLGPGERTRLHFDVANVSAVAIGHATDRERKVGVQITFADGDIGPEDVVFFNARGDEVDLASRTLGFEGHFELIPSIDAHNIAHSSVLFGFKEHVPPYAGARLIASLWIEEYDNSGSWRLVQQRDATFRAEPEYSYRPESRIILVTNNNTSREGFLAWRELLENQLGLPFDHWSLGRYGHFDHQHDLEDGTNLRVHLEDKVALVLNQEFEPRGSQYESDLPTDYIKGRDVREGATSNNTHFLMAGSDKFSPHQLLEPTSDLRRGGDDFPDTKRFLEKEAATGGPLTTELFKEDITTYWDEVKMYDWTFFSTPAQAKIESMMRAESIDMMQKLERMHPNRRYVIVEHTHDEAIQDGRSWLVFPRWDLGKIEVRRTLNTESSSVLVLHASGEEINSRDFVLDIKTRYSVLLAMPFEVKLDRLNWLMQVDGELSGHQLETARALVAALMTDLSEEQSALSEGAGRLDEERLEQKLSNLGRFVREPLHTAFSASSNKWEILFELAASLIALSKSTRWWRFWGRDRKIAKHTERVVEKWSRELFDKYAIDPDGDVAMSSATAEERVEEQVEALIERFKYMKTKFKRETGLRSTMSTIARDYFEHPKLIEGRVQRDIDVWLDSTNRIWTREELEKAAAREEARNAKQEQLRELNERRRAELLHTEPQETPAHPEVELDFDEEVILEAEREVDPDALEQAPEPIEVSAHANN